MKIQLKRSNVLQSGAAKEPTASQLEYGELAINYNNSDPAIFLKDSNNNIIRISGVGNIADDGLTNVPAGTTPPTNPTPESGNLWYNSDEGRLYIYYVDANTSQWVDASPDSWDPTVMPVTTNPAAQTGTLDDRYVMENGDTMTGALLLDNAASASLPDLSFDGDTNTGIYSPAADTVAITTAATERLRIDSSGNVGIGGSAANYSDHKTLSVFGAANTGAGFIQFTDTSGNADAAIFVDDGNLTINADYDNTSANSTIRFRVDGSSEKMRIDSSGNVGIGITSPSNNLHINQADSGNNFVQFTNSTTGTASSDGGLVGINTAEQLLLWNYENDDVLIGTDNSERMRIDSSGRVGVGVSSPITILHTKTATADGYIITENSSNQQWVFGPIDATYAQVGGLLGVHTGVTVNLAGNVGIGTNAPNHKLTLGTETSTGTATPETISLGGTYSTTAGANPKLRLWTDGTSQMGIGVSSSQIDYITTSLYDHVFFTNNTERMRIDRVGNVGIGTSPDATVKLHLNNSASTTFKIKHGANTGFNTIQLTNDNNKNAFVWQQGSQQGAYGGFNSLNVVNYDGAITFGASTAGGYAEKMRILTTGGVTFNGDTAQANALDDYEEGTFLPEVRGTTSAGTASYSHRHGQYVKVGHLVHIQMYLAWTGGTGTGNLEIHNLPFANNSVNTAYGGVAVGYWHTIPLNTNYYPLLFVSYNNNYIHCYQGPLGGGAATTVSYSATGGGIIVSATYRAA